MKTTEEKYQDLQDYLLGLGSVAVPFSGGVDSTFLLRLPTTCWATTPWT